ncbi:DoxX family protein [Dyadobacter pollutisoli]|jgi:hypothetical protein|uniref:DoxX family protein n=1 Tax=Dyadobacter pollutisoli TaxID=2910158 RepID=A0A9E8SPD3_9BACT|nr:DoxX family protein [Dyadobacter pollutisoli]WAC15254.1 DoxX family protein [Dyadobacter pollutisoli]
MEATFVNQTTVKSQGNKGVLIGRIISALCILFLLVDAIMKVLKDSISVEGSAKLGWPVDQVQSIGIALLISTILYIIPRTAILGAILLTGYLGGAIAIMVRAGEPLYFASIFGVLVWAGLYLRDEKLRKLIPFSNNTTH